jgi:predicted N-acetyltransferase YhbS
MVRLVEVGTGPERDRYLALGGAAEAGPDALARQRPDALLLLEGPPGPAARCALWWAETATHDGRRVGAIGHYFAADAAAGERLLGLACDRLARQGCGLAVGPLDGSTWRRYRLVTESGPDPSFFLEPDNPPDWAGHFAAAGFTALARYHSALATDLDRPDPRADEAARRFEARGGAVRALRPDDFDGEVRRIHALSLTSFRDNLLFTPLGLDEFRAQAEGLREFLRPDLILLAERDGRLVGFVFAVPDLLQAHRGRAIDTAVIKTLAVHPDERRSGLGSMLADRCHRSARRLGYRRAVHALMHDPNPSARISRRTARFIRRYALFARPLGPGGP